MRGHVISVALLAGASLVAVSALAAEKDCSAVAVGKRIVIKPHAIGIGQCIDTDRGNDPYEYGQTRYRRQTLSYRDRKVQLEDGRSGVEEYYCHLPFGILKQVYSCPCGIYEPVRTRAVCRTEMPGH